MKSPEELTKKLLSRIYTTDQLRQVSDLLEILTQNHQFKSQATAIASDSTLTESQKKTQLLYLIKEINAPLLFNFFHELLVQGEFWVFNSSKIDYFDRFVQEFQLQTESVGVVFLTTAVALEPQELAHLALDLSHSFGYRVVLNYSVNPSIIGGTQVRIENLVFDYSLKTKFQQFQSEWIRTLRKTNKLIGRLDV